MASGPTQNYDDPTLVGWRPHPTVAMLVRAGLAVLPLAVAVGFGLTAARALPPNRVGLQPWAWLAIEVTCIAGLLLLVARLTRRLLPLAALLRLTLILPDRVPSRFSVARRRHSPEALRRTLDHAAAAGDPGGPEEAHILLDLVGALAAHDRSTFRHSERVQAYTALIAQEMGLSAEDTARLAWAALLHDVGKLAVPADVLNKTTRPDADEWSVIADHAAHGAAVAGRLREWLGPWASAIDQHHERWDGQGYPYGLAGRGIHLGARVVAVADAFDVITSARSYKRPLPAEAARAELARCAGTQFDPDVVRAFLAVGLGRVRTIVGPLSVLSAVPGFAPAVQGSTAVAGRATGLVPASAPALPAFAVAAVVGVGLAAAGPTFAATTPPPRPAVIVTETRPDITAVPDGGADGGELAGADAGTLAGSDPGADPAIGEATAPSASEPDVATTTTDGDEGATEPDATEPDGTEPDGIAPEAPDSPRTVPALPETASDTANDATSKTTPSGLPDTTADAAGDAPRGSGTAAD